MHCRDFPPQLEVYYRVYYGTGVEGIAVSIKGIFDIAQNYKYRKRLCQKICKVLYTMYGEFKMKIYKESVSAPEISWAIVDIIITCIFMLTTLFIGGLAVYACMTLMNDFCLIFVWVGIIVNMLCFIAKSVTVANIVAKKYKKAQ